jgi:signal transduction histidine kinase
MEKILRSVKFNFMATIMFVVVAVTGLSWAILQWYNNTEIATPAHISEIHKASENNPAFAQYIEDQKAFEAHFLALADSIKQQESERLTQGLAITTSIVVAIGAIGAFIAARKLVKPVEEAYRSQERFIQDAAHELRNPLAAMSAAIQQADSKTKATPLVKTFQRQTNRLVHINEDLLFLERRDNQPPQKIPLHDLLLDVLEELQPLAASKNITFSVTNQDKIEKTMRTTDYVRLVKNIVDNAVKYSPSGSKVEIMQRKHKGVIELTVTDYGIGIPKEELALVGSRFYRAKNTGNIDGTGLGLAIVQKILNTYGGSKTITSHVKNGTVVTIHLPA